MELSRRRAGRAVAIGVFLSVAAGTLLVNFSYQDVANRICPAPPTYPASSRSSHVRRPRPPRQSPWGLISSSQPCAIVSYSQSSFTSTPHDPLCFITYLFFSILVRRTMCTGIKCCPSILILLLCMHAFGKEARPPTYPPPSARATTASSF